MEMTTEREREMEMEGVLLEALGPESVDEAAVLTTRTELGNTVLHMALSHGKVKGADELWRRCPTLLWMENNRKETPLHIAASSWNHWVLDWLVSLLSDDNWDLNEKKRALGMRDANGNTPLHRLVMRRIRARFNEEIIFHIRQTELVRAMLRVDGELSLCLNNAGETALYLAANVGSMKVVHELLECPSPPIGNGGNNGRSALHAAARHRIIENIDGISIKRPNYIDSCDDSDWSPLHCAASLDNIDMVRILLDRGCLIDKLSKDGATPVHIAAAMGFLGVLQVLVEKRPDCLEVLDSRGRNALHVAAQNGRPKIVKYILQEPQFGELVNQKDNDGNTPLQLIKKHEWELLTIFLMDRRVQLFSENNLGETIVDDICKIPGDSVNMNMGFFHSILLLAVNLSILSAKSVYNERLSEYNKSLYRNLYDWRMKKLSIVATLVATVTFAAGLAAPGGYINKEGSEEGLAVLGRKPAFRAFIFLDSLAMLLSVMVVAMSCAHAEFVSTYIIFITVMASMMLDWALIFMTWAFTCGIYAILEPYSRGLVIVICLFCSASMLFLTVVGSYTFVKLGFYIGLITQAYTTASRLSTVAERELR